MPNVKRTKWKKIARKIRKTRNTTRREEERGQKIKGKNVYGESVWISLDWAPYTRMKEPFKNFHIPKDRIINCNKNPVLYNDVKAQAPLSFNKGKHS